jgi:hypothetical protein
MWQTIVLSTASRTIKKARWRAKAARTLDALEQAIAEALAAITSQDAHGWFAHAGYGIAAN